MLIPVDYYVNTMQYQDRQVGRQVMGIALWDNCSQQSLDLLLLVSWGTKKASDVNQSECEDWKTRLANGITLGQSQGLRTLEFDDVYPIFGLKTERNNA